MPYSEMLIIILKLSNFGDNLINCLSAYVFFFTWVITEVNTIRGKIESIYFKIESIVSWAEKEPYV